MAINYVSAQAASVTSSTTVYTPTSAGVQATLIGCLLANTTTSSVSATVTLTNATASTVTNIVYNVPIPVGASLDVMNSAKIVMPLNYVLKVSATGAVDVTVSTIEVT
jgi:hypothetical protein